MLYVAESGLRTAVMRALLSVPGHFFFAVYMGIYLGEAKVCERSGQRRRRGYYLLCSLAVPVLLHGFWDFDLSIPSPWATVVFYVFVLAFFCARTGFCSMRRRTMCALIGRCGRETEKAAKNPRFSQKTTGKTQAFAL